MLRLPLRVASNLNSASSPPSKAISSLRCFSSTAVESSQSKTKETSDASSKKSSSPPSSSKKDGDNGKVKVTRIAPRGIPTRHSRHHVPIVAPKDVLEESCQKIISSIPGTLFKYDSKNLHQSKTEEYEEALKACHSLQQKVEYLLRGYSSLLPGSISDLQNKNGNANDKSNGDEIIAKMMKLLERVEQEGKTYVELRSKFRSQLAQVSSNIDADDNIEIDTESNADEDDFSMDSNVETDNASAPNAWKMNSLIANYGAPPGPTATMYDLILDAIAVSTPSSNDPLSLLKASRELHSKAVDRYELDIKAGMDALNPSSCPTPATFNAVIRAAASVSNQDDEIRDTAIENGLYVFNTMYHHSIVHRNASTYRHILDVIRTHFPVGEMRGNIAAGIWEKAVQDKVVDLTVFDAMMKVGNAEHGKLFDGWWKGVKAEFKKDMNGYGFPIVWGKNKNLRRFDKRFDMY